MRESGPCHDCRTEPALTSFDDFPEPLPQVRKLFGKFWLRLAKCDGLSNPPARLGEYLTSCRSMIAFTGPVAALPIFAEGPFGIADQFFDEAFEKFARSVANASTCSRIQYRDGSE